MREFFGFSLMVCIGMGLGGWSQSSKQTRATIEACNSKQVLIIKDRVFRCTEINVSDIEKAKGGV